MAAKARQVLIRRGAPRSTIDDALQAAAERALRRFEPFDGLQGWTNWTIKVAWHEVQAEWRRQARTESGEPPERDGGVDVSDVVERRFELAVLADGLTGLSPADRNAILAGLSQDEQPGEEPLSPGEKMRRYRTRRRLAALIAGNAAPTKPRKDAGAS